MLLLLEDEAVSLAHIRKTTAMPEEMQRNWTDPLWIFLIPGFILILYDILSSTEVYTLSNACTFDNSNL